MNNLISNAIKYSPPGSTLEVHVTLLGKSVEISDKDYGIGIPSEEMNLLFKPFTRLLSRPTVGEQSTGLGLSITKRIVKGHGGRVWAQSQSHISSTFTFSIPIVND